MKDEVLFSLSYGMYAIGVKDEKRPSACIVNTVFQVTNTPNMVAVSMNHNNYSHECIRKTGLFTVSVLFRGYARDGDRGARFQFGPGHG